MTPSVELGLGESAERVVPGDIQRSVYRGALWRLAAIGQLRVAAVEIGLLVAALFFVAADQSWPAILAGLGFIGVSIWSRRRIARWAAEHNARVARLEGPPSGRP